MESRHFRTGQNILLSCPQCLDSMLAPDFMNSVYVTTSKTLVFIFVFMPTPKPQYEFTEAQSFSVGRLWRHPAPSASYNDADFPTRLVCHGCGAGVSLNKAIRRLIVQW